MVYNQQMEQDLVLEQRVQEINAAAEQIARLNGEISRVISIGEQPNDLMDQRDMLFWIVWQRSPAQPHPNNSNGEVGCCG